MRDSNWHPDPNAVGRRDFLALGLSLAAAALLPRGLAAAATPTAAPLPRRRLGALEVSALGLGCMSMAPGTYNHPPPPRAEMVALIRAAGSMARGRQTPTNNGQTLHERSQPAT